MKRQTIFVVITAFFLTAAVFVFMGFDFGHSANAQLAGPNPNLASVKSGVEALLASVRLAQASPQDGKRQSRIQEFRRELESYEDQVSKLKKDEQSAAKKREVELLDDEIKYLRVRIAELENPAPFTKTLRRGSTGDDVRRLQEVLNSRGVYPEGLATGFFGPATERAVKRFQERNGLESVGIVGPKTREKLNEFADIPKPLTPARDLSQGSSGDDVKEIQELLKKFPDIYPQGLATGFFGLATENAVKKLQEKLGLEVVGRVGPQTREKLGGLEAAVSRKSRPHITSVSSGNPSVNDELIITGSGFTFEKNSIFIKGRIWLKDLASSDGTSIKFFITPDIQCAQDGHEACPIKVVNENGISNARPFKLAQSNTPEPPQNEPPEPSRKKQDLILLSLSPAYGKVGDQIILTGTGFTSSSNTVTLGGGFNKTGVYTYAKIEGLTSADGITLKFTIPATPCVPPDLSCSVSVTNKNGISNELFFAVIQQVTPVGLVLPNGGEQFVQGSQNSIKWSGGTGSVNLWLLEEAATEDFSINLASFGDLLVGSIGSGLPIGAQQFLWDSRNVCDANFNCWPVSPGKYKVFAVSENEAGNYESYWLGSARFYNRDVSDQPFTILPAPKIAVLSPNGGEKLVYGTSATVSWEATSIVSQAVKINLLKNGVFYKTIADNVPQGAHTGVFIYSWTPTSDIPGADDYTIEIADIKNALVKDAGDGKFSIVPKSTITLVKPNGGETLFKGFQTTVRWNSGNISSQSVNIDLYKGGTFLRRLASNVPQKYYSWQTTSYISGTGFNYALAVPTDILDGVDYALVISDSADAATNDASDAVFSVISVPDPVTLRGRLINSLNSNPLINTRLHSFLFPAGVNSASGVTVATTDSEGRFSISTTTADLISGQTWYKSPVNGWPTCYANWAERWMKGTENINWFRHIFDFAPDTSMVLSKGDNDLGDVPMWPMTGLYFYTNVGIFSPGVSTLASPGVSYPDSGYWGWQILALGHDLQVRVYDPTTSTYHLSPSIVIPLANGCAPKTLTYLGGVFKWEPYNVRSSIYFSSATVGVAVKTTFSASGGVAPYTWGLYYGSLPPGLVLDSSTGVLSGIPTIAGTYKFQIKITDSNGVNGGTWPMTVIVK
ncbi:MAG: peptidoglycan-binding protein [Candidatus Sungbacteria bacterium]|nr:peptidoglycan-binding protein [Candidatus Sungbacteria bacterium]